MICKRYGGFSNGEKSKRQVESEDQDIAGKTKRQYLSSNYDLKENWLWFICCGTIHWGGER